MTGEIIEVHLDTMAHGGSALGREGGRVVFVPYTIPGERVRARVVQAKGRTLFAEGETLLEASADRVFPRCPHFGAGKCSRCQWQHIDYTAQLLLKQDVLADQLERIGGFSAPDIQPIIASPQQWGYNLRMTMQVTEAGELGFPAGRTLIPITECHILHPDLLVLKDSLDLEHMSGLQELTLQRGSDGAQMIIIRMAQDQPPELTTDVPMSVNMLLSDNQPINLIGETHSRYTVKDRLFRVTAGSFFRANVAQVENLMDVVLHALDLRGDEAVLDLYAGVGLFSAFIAPRTRLVTLVESYPPAVSDAEQNLADIDNLDILEGGVEAVLDALDERYDAALIDPPGDGLGLEALDALTAAGIPRLVYISSDPATLARDGKRLAAAGYRLTSVQPIDSAPQTYYVDAIARFDKQA